MTATAPLRPRPLASVVIPTHDDADHLMTALDLVRAQTWPQVEIVVADDASAEPVEPRVRASARPGERITVLRRERNGGVAAAQQAGLEQARGDYVYLASTNDPIEPRFLEESISALERHPGAGLSFSDPGIVTGWTGRREAFRLHVAARETFFAPDAFASRLRRRPFHIASNTVVFRKSALIETGGCRPELGLYADWFTVVVTALRRGAVYLPEVLAYSRDHAGAYSAPGRWPRPARLAAAATVMAAIAHEEPQLVARVKRSAALSELGARALLTLSRDPRCRPLIDLGTLWVACLRASWRRVLPRGSRSLMRRLLMCERHDRTQPQPDGRRDFWQTTP
jgi:GT2 family glycosyltransferase